MSVCQILDTDYGPMLVPSNDFNQTQALRDTRKGVHHDRMQLLADLLDRMPADRVVVDAGANLGAFAVPLSAHLGGDGGWLHAFEPQPVICQMLAGSLVLTQRVNARAHCVCLGDHDGMIRVPQFDYTSNMNYGSIEFGPEQIEILNQARGNNPAKIEYVDLLRLDWYDFPRLDLMKIDVQRMELQLLEGARETLARCRPVLFIEWIDQDPTTLTNTLVSHGYRISEVVGDDWLCLPQ